MRRQKRSLRKPLLVLLSCLVIPSALFAGSGTPAYKWTLEQRLRVRFDPADMEKRMEAIRMVPQPKRGANVVDGAKNPELLLPHELFQALLKRGFDEDIDARKAWREKLEPLATELGIDSDFWPTLATIAAAIIPEVSSGRLEGTWEENCLERFEALEAARKAFGKRTFDRLLYEGVAPGIRVSSWGNGTEKEIRDAADGCRDSSNTANAF